MTSKRFLKYEFQPQERAFIPGRSLETDGTFNGSTFPIFYRPGITKFFGGFSHGTFRSSLVIVRLEVVIPAETVDVLKQFRSNL